MGNGISRTSSIFRDVHWLGFTHDGHPVGPLSSYEANHSHDDGSTLTITELSTPAVALARAVVTQSLLSFGLLEAVLEVAVPERALLRPDVSSSDDGGGDGGGGFVMSSEAISSLLLECVLRIQLASDADCATWLLRAQTALKTAHQMLLLYQQPGMNIFARAGLAEGEVMANMSMVAAIGEALVNLTRHFPRKVHGLLPDMGLDWSFVVPRKGSYVDEMVTRGWCPATARMMGSSVATMQYVALQEPLEGDVEHGGCRQDVCLAYSVDTQTYKPKHTTAECDCAYLKPSFEDVADNISRGVVPVMVLGGASDGTQELITCSATDTEYVAISHVWADGLGSTTEKGLPRCQLLRIAEMTRQVLPDGEAGGAFWIDGLCVPERRDLRKRAIGLMGHTYESAQAVLVIDKGIRTCSVDDPIRVKLLRIHTSIWMRRLWTFQEAVLARRLVFWFVDGLVEFEDLVLSLNDSLDVVNMHLAATLVRVNKKKSTDFFHFSIGDAMRGVKCRSTSRAEDETLAIASLLNVDALELVNLPPQKRMTSLLTQVRHLPRNILLLPGPKSEDSTFNWAPKSFMTSIEPELALATNKQDAECTLDGLVAEYRAFLFDPVIIETGQTWLLQDTSDDRYFGINDPIDDDHADIGSYRCDGLLFIDPLRKEHIVVCVAILSHPQERPVGDEEFVQRCTYKRRLLITTMPSIVETGENPASGLIVKGRFRTGNFCVN